MCNLRTEIGEVVVELDVVLGYQEIIVCCDAQKFCG